MCARVLSLNGLNAQYIQSGPLCFIVVHGREKERNGPLCMRITRRFSTFFHSRIASNINLEYINNGK